MDLSNDILVSLFAFSNASSYRYAEALERMAETGEGEEMAGAYHITCLHNRPPFTFVKPHLSCFSTFTTTEATTLFAAIKSQVKRIDVSTSLSFQPHLSCYNIFTTTEPTT
jgi:hypothetical protein